MLEMVKRGPTRTSQTQRQPSTRAGSEVLVSLGVRPTPLQHALHHASLDHVDSSIRTWNMRRHERIVMVVMMADFLSLMMMIMTSLTAWTRCLGNLSIVPIARGLQARVGEKSIFQGQCCIIWYHTVIPPQKTPPCKSVER